MTSRRQRTRMPNFTVAEEDVLRALTAKYYKQIEEKTSNASVWRVKNRAWENIAIEFFKNTRIQRSAVKLKSKYETMKKLNKLSNVSIKREPTPVENSLRLVGQNGKVGEPKVELVQVEVEPAKLFDLVKTEIHSKENADLVNQDQAMSVHPHAEAPFDDGDQIMTEDDKSQAARLSAESTEKGVRDIRELVQTNFSQGDEEITVDKNNIPCRLAGIETLQGNDGINTGLISKELSLAQRTLVAQFHYYRNSDIRAQEKHLAELKNLQVQHQILELELMMKQKEFHKNE